MTETPHPLRRVVLGLGSAASPEPAIETAARLAAAFRSELFCLLVQQESLLSLAGLPFARSFGLGGRASDLTQESLRENFAGLVRSANRELAGHCSRMKVTWRIDQPLGQTWVEVERSLMPGDVAVVTLRDVPPVIDSIEAAFRSLLDRAAAIVIAGSRPISAGSVVVPRPGPEGGEAAAIASEIAAGLGQPLELLDGSDRPSISKSVSVVVWPIEHVAVANLIHLVSRPGRARPTLVLVK